LPAKLTAEHTRDPARFINTMMGLGEHQAVLNFLAWSMPKRLSLFWAFYCCWTTELDRDRHMAREEALPGGKKAPAASVKPEKTPAVDLEALEKIKKDTEKSKKEALAQLEEMGQKAIQALTRIRDALPEAAAPISDFHRFTDLNHSMHMAMAAARAQDVAERTQPKPVKIVHPTPKVKLPKKKVPKVPDPLKPLQFKIRRAQREGQLRGMASCLQWVLDPCQKHAFAAKDAVPHIHGNPRSTALAKATFWCGENMSDDPKKPQIPPPPALPMKGIQVAITKALATKDTSWSKKDKIHWYLEKGLAIAEGKFAWDETPEQFDRYVEWALDSEGNNT
ncbi:MAG: hypothetical protein MK085_13955, partial [Phycisphaerales bacterium]|nr:hypothetical protein [Phycisphaerales bacterium]